MKKIVWNYGIIAGLISTLGFIITSIGPQEIDMAEGMIYGFAAMLVAFSLIFFAIKNYRDKHNGGIITFGQAFKMGLYISLIASTVYVITWLITYYFFIPDFYEQYAQSYLDRMQAAGLPQATIEENMKQMTERNEFYKNPLMIIIITYTEIIWIGVVIALIAAGVLKRETPKTI